jgi:cytochrome c oxidase accessory protein FixG
MGLGDCIDCSLCVQVCPTGIDIRNGLQNECIGCAACIDVCDDVMGRMNYPPGLIRYSTENGVANHLTRNAMLRRVVRPRVLIYGAVLLAASVAFVASLSLRKGFTVDIIKDRGSLARVVEDGQIENVFTLHIANGTEQAQHYRVEASGLPGLRIATPAELDVPSTGLGTLVLRLVLPPEAAAPYRGRANPISLEVSTERDGVVTTKNEKTTYYVPR